MKTTCKRSFFILKDNSSSNSGRKEKDGINERKTKHLKWE